jgi:hypothetical protein
MSGSITPSQQRLEKLMMRRVERKYRSESGTPMLAADHERAATEIQSSLRRAQHEAKLTDRVAGELLQRAKSTTPAPTPTPSVTFSEVSKSRARETPMKLPESQHRLRHAPTPLEKIPMAKGTKQEELWLEIDRQRDLDARVEEVRKNLAFRERIRLQRDDLDTQVTRKATRKVVVKVDTAADRRLADANHLLFVQDEARKKAKARDIALDIKQDREEQVAVRVGKRVVEKEEFDQQEEDILRRIKAEVAADARRADMVKEQVKVQRAALIAANEVQKEIKRDVSKKLQADEAVYIRLADEKMDREQKAREAQWDYVKSKMKGREQIAFELAVTMKDISDEDERRAHEVTLSRERAVDEKLAKEVAQRKASTRIVHACQVEQVKAKEVVREADHVEYVAERGVMAKAVTVDMRSLQRDRDVRREKLVRSNRDLTSQIVETQKRQTVLISDEEKRINSHWLGSEGK